MPGQRLHHRRPWIEVNSRLWAPEDSGLVPDTCTQRSALAFGSGDPGLASATGQ